MLTKRKGHKLHYADRGSLNGIGKTITEAKANLNGKVDAALEGSYHPALVNFGQWSALVYRDPHGWNYKILQRPDMVADGIIDVRFGSCGFTSLGQATQAAAAHVLDLDSREDFHVDSDIPTWLTDPSDRRDLLYKGRFQRAYAWAKANMPEIADNDHLLHAWACDNDRDPRFA